MNDMVDEKKVIIELQNVKRDFMVGDELVHALRGVSFKIMKGEFRWRLCAQYVKESESGSA